jgi:hypothetical protein
MYIQIHVYIYLYIHKHRLRSDFIVSVKDVVQTMNNLYIVTERGGRDLFESFDDNPDGVPELWVRICIYIYMHTYIDR